MKYHVATMEPHVAAAQWYFPYYKIDLKHAEIGLREYDLAAKALESDHKSLTAAAGLTLFFTGAITTFLGSSAALENLASIVAEVGAEFEIGLIAGVMIIACLALHYFARLQRSSAYAARKIVVLRRLLGLDYGNIESVLPTDRLDGANEPFSVPMFPGWTSIQALPAVVVTLLACVFISGVVSAMELWAKANAASSLRIFWQPTPLQLGAIWGTISGSGLLVFYRWLLIEDFETPRTREAVFFGRVLGAPLKARLGYVLYRLRLSVFEAERLGFKLEGIFDLLVHIEDKRFYKHNGNSFVDLVSALIR